MNKWTAADWAVCVAAAVISVSAVSGVVVVAATTQPDSKIDWPAWVQAVGSVAAIFVAVFISRAQSAASRLMLLQQWEREESRSSKSNMELLRAQVGLAERIASLAGDACGSIAGIQTDIARDASLRAHILTEGVDVLDAMPIAQVPGVFISLDVLSLRLATRRLLAVMKDVEGANRLAPSQRDLVAQLSERFAEIRKSLQRTGDAYDGRWTVIRAADI